MYPEPNLYSELVCELIFSGERIDSEEGVRLASASLCEGNETVEELKISVFHYTNSYRPVNNLNLATIRIHAGPQRAPTGKPGLVGWGRRRRRVLVPRYIPE